MSLSERNRLDVLSRVKRKELNVMEAAVLLGLSLRQSRRVSGRFKADGASTTIPTRTCGRLGDWKSAPSAAAGFVPPKALRRLIATPTQAAVANPIPYCGRTKADSSPGSSMLQENCARHRLAMEVRFGFER